MWKAAIYRIRVKEPVPEILKEESYVQMLDRLREFKAHNTERVTIVHLSMGDYHDRKY